MIPYQKPCAIMSWVISEREDIKSSFQQGQETALAVIRWGQCNSGHTGTEAQQRKITIFTQISGGFNPWVAIRQ